VGERSEVAVPEKSTLYYTGRARRHPMLRICRLLQLHKVFPHWFATKSDQIISRRIAAILSQHGWPNHLDLVIKDFTSDTPSYFDGQKVVSVIHQMLSGDWQDSSLRRKARTSFILAAVSRTVAEDAQRLGLKVDHILHNPLDVVVVREKAGAVKVDGDYLLYVGGLNFGKGVFDLLEAYARARIPPSLWFVGSGRERLHLEQRAQALGIAARVRFLGFQSNPYPYIVGARLLVLPSRSEAMPYVCLESACLGTPFLVSGFEAAGEFFEPRITVALLPETDLVDRLAQRIVRELDQPLAPGLKAGILELVDPLTVARSYLALV
jgi:glycosyltransferase involved in cell wall biosynthesis